MKFNPSRRLLCVLLPICMTLAACGGGGGDAAGNNTLAAASSNSFSPTTAKASSGQNVALRWVYAVNNGQPVTAKLLGVSIGISVSTAEVTLDPGSLKRVVTMQGAVSGSASGTTFDGSFAATSGADLLQSAGKTLFKNQSTEVNLTLTGGGETATGKLTAAVGAFAPAYEWFLDRETLDQLPIGYVQTVTSNGVADINITITGETPIVKSNLATAVSDRWTVLEKLPTLVVRGKTYTNVVKASLQTRVPDFSGGLTTVTIYYWVAKGVGMIKGQGIFRILDVDDVIYELTETNLAQV